jgi:hypothetical protein
MRWNWQLPDWPDFRFDADRIRAFEEQFLKGSGVVIGALHHLDTDERDGLTIELISQEVVDSSAIEGETREIWMGVHRDTRHAPRIVAVQEAIVEAIPPTGRCCDLSDCIFGRAPASAGKYPCGFA